MALKFESWLHPTDRGLFCVPGQFHIDPTQPVERAIITHGHSDHARAGHGAVLTTPETAEIMQLRLGSNAARRFERIEWGALLSIGETRVSLHPAGHILGSAQIRLEYRGQRVVVSGDYKRRSDPTCHAFEPVPCDLFITEATFGLPVFRHEPDDREIARLLTTHAANMDRTLLVGVYGLGKCQRLIALLRAAGYDRRIFLHGALEAMCGLYEQLGIKLGDLAPVGTVEGRRLAGELVLCPPSALQDRWSRRLVDPITAFASGWMRIRGRARQRGVELPLVISDHADWPELIRTIEETGAEEVWITHGREDALVYHVTQTGRRARALDLVGYEDETGE